MPIFPCVQSKHSPMIATLKRKNIQGLILGGAKALRCVNGQLVEKEKVKVVFYLAQTFPF